MHEPEQVLVIPVETAQEIAPKVFQPAPAGVEDKILGCYSFLEREAAETNFAFKQVIPYILVTANTGSDELPIPVYLLAQRTSQQQEKRLHNKFSIGQGGHINRLDFSGAQSAIMECLLREIREEFTLDEIIKCSPVGLINDNSTEVSRVHLGLAYHVRVASTKMAVAEHGKHTGQWEQTCLLRRYYDRMEPWSQILLDHVVDCPVAS